MQTFSMRSGLLALLVLASGFWAFAQTPTIVVNGDTSLADNTAKFPLWLNASMTLAKGQNVNSISVIEFDVVNNGGTQVLNFSQVKLVSAQETVPSGKVWKVESVALHKNAGSSGGGGDNWGGQTVFTNATLTGGGTSGSPLDIAQQGATNNQVLKWDGSSWTPADPSSYSDATITGDGTSGSPFGLAQQGATNGQVLIWNGVTWAPATNVAAPNDCPSGFTAVNNEYCIQTNENGSAAFFTASNACRNLGARLCDWTEWQYACQKGGLSPSLVNMTNNHEWIDDPDAQASYGNYGDADAYGRLVGNGGCQGTSQYYGHTTLTNSRSYRCCFTR